MKTEPLEDVGRLFFLYNPVVFRLHVGLFQGVLPGLMDVRASSPELLGHTMVVKLEWMDQDLSR